MRRMILSAYFPSIVFAIIIMSTAAFAKDETWNGEKVIEEPVKLTKSTLKIDPKAKIIFKGKGALSLEGGKLIAENVDFSADEAITGAFRIYVKNAEVQLKQCSFNKMIAVNPAQYMDGAICLSTNCTGSIAGCTFTECSALAVANGNGLTIEKNQFIRPETGIFLFNSRENRVMNNSFEGASKYAICLNGASLNTISDNRFTDCALGCQLFWKTTSDNRFTGNSFFGGKQGVHLRESGKSNYFQGNLFEKVDYAVASFPKPFGADTIFANNVFAHCRVVLKLPVQPDAAPVTFRDNAVYHATYGLVGGCKAVVAENNLIWECNKPSDAGEMKNTVAADPKFKDPENGDYRPADGSPLLKAGTKGANIGMFK